MATVNDISPGASAQLAAAERAASQQKANTGPNLYGVSRIPFILTCRLWAELGLSSYPGALTGNRFITLPFNPGVVKWRMGYRMVEEKSAAGRILFAWKHRDRKSFQDEPILTFTFRAGNIGSGLVDANGDIQPTDGMVSFWEIFRLLDEEKAIPTKIGKTVITASQGAGEPNFVQITYSSLKFPLLTLIGFFAAEGSEFDDSAADPLDWTLVTNFVVYDSVPRFSNARAMKDAFMANAI